MTIEVQYFIINVQSKKKIQKKTNSSYELKQTNWDKRTAKKSNLMCNIKRLQWINTFKLSTWKCAILNICFYCKIVIWMSSLSSSKLLHISARISIRHFVSPRQILEFWKVERWFWVFFSFLCIYFVMALPLYGYLTDIAHTSTRSNTTA